MFLYVRHVAGVFVTISVQEWCRHLISGWSFPPVAAQIMCAREALFKLAEGGNRSLFTFVSPPLDGFWDAMKQRQVKKRGVGNP